jgi:MFS family permease
MKSPLTWRQAIGAFSRDARLYLVSAALMGFTIFGGIYSLLMNLYLLRLGYGPGSIGLVNAAAMLGWAAACLPAGWLGRRWGSRRSMVVGMAISLAGHLLVPLCEIAPAGPWRLAWLVSAGLVGNIAIALFDVNSQPFLAVASTPTERDHLFSVQAALWPLAGFVGSLAGGVIPSLCAGLLGTSTGSPAAYRYPLIASALVMGFAVWALARTRDHRLAEAGPPAAAVPGEPPAHTLPRSVIPLLGLAMFLQGSGEGAVRTFFNVYLDDALGSPTSVIGVLVAIGQLASVPAALLMPAAARRWGHRGVFAWGTLGIGIGMLPLALVPGWAAAGVGYLLVIALVSLTRAAVGVYLMETMSVGLRTTMSGVYTMAMGLSWSAVALGGSRVITSLGYPAFYLGAAALTAASAAVFAVVSRGLRAGGSGEARG